MSRAICQRGTFISLLALCSALVLGPGSTACAQPVIPVAPGQVKAQFEGIGDSQKGGISLTIAKLGQLSSSNGARLGDGSVCPQAARLAPSGLTIVCPPDASLLEWYKKVLAGTTDRKSGSIIYLDRAGSEVLRTYNLFECWPTSLTRYEGGDCDDTDPGTDLMEVTFSVTAVQIVGQTQATTKSIKQGHYAVSNFHIEVDGQSGGYLSSKSTVTGVEISLNAASLAKGEQPDSLSMATSFAILLGADDDCDGICEMILQSQGKPVPPTPMKASINTTRSNIKNNRAVTLPPTVLNIQGAQIRNVTLPTFQTVPNPPSPPDGMAIEKIDIAVEKVERA